jgi:K+-sensing histidine kinase KdpD
MIQGRNRAHLAIWKCWTFAFLATATATVLQMIYLKIEGNCALIPPIAAVMVTASVAGLRPSLVTLPLNLIIAEYIVIPPYYSFALSFINGVIPLVTLIAFASLAWYSALWPVEQQMVRSVSNVSRSKIRRLVRATAPDRARTRR